MTSGPRFLVVRLSSLGDILHTVPAVRMLKASFPNSRIDWIVESRFRFLADAIPGIDFVHTIDTKAMRVAGHRATAYRQAAATLISLRRENFDAALDFQGLIKSALFATASGARVRCGFGRDLVREKPAHWFYHRRAVAPRSSLHVTRLNQLIAGLAGAHTSPEDPIQLRIPDRESAAAEALLGERKRASFLVLNPGGGWETKRWHPERYGQLAVRVARELGLESIVTTGPGEEALYDRIAAFAAGCVTNFSVPFLQLVPVMERSALVVGGDTGPFHLACAIGTPVVGVFGPTAPERNGPWKPGEECVVRKLPCSFCNGRTCPTRNECMDISVDDVFSAVVRTLDRIRFRPVSPA